MLAVVMRSLGMDGGEWDLSVRAVDGKPRRARGVMVEASHGTTLGYDQLSEIRAA